METDRDYSSLPTDASPPLSMEYSIVHSPPFTFLVGPKHTKLTVQSGLARHVSQPLDHLMNSGQTRESKHHIAVLEDEDVETFVAFCEYAYTGDYNVPPPGSREDDRQLPGPVPVPVPVPGSRSGSIGTIAAPTPVSPRATAALKRGFSGGEDVHAAYLPSPPRSAGTSEKEVDRPVAAPLASVSAPAGDGDEAGAEEIAPVSNHHQPGEESQEPAAASAEDVDPWSEVVETPPAKEKKSKKNKKGKKSKTTVQPEEEPSNDLTPPSTPLLTDTREGEPAPAAEINMQDDWDSNEVSRSVDAAAAAGQTDTSNPSPAAGAEDDWDDSIGAATPAVDDGTATPAVVDDEQQQQDGDNAASNLDEPETQSDQRKGPIIDTSFAKQHFSSHHEKGLTSMWDEFASLDYIDPRQMSASAGMTRPPSVLSTSSSHRADLPYLVFHAKVYVFAARYLIPALAQLCLRKLHRDLVNLGFHDDAQSYIPTGMNGIHDVGGNGNGNGNGEEEKQLTSAKAKMVLDLLHYTYTKTTRLEPISPNAATQLRDNELRKLVVHYAACKVRDLAEDCPPMEGGYPVKPSDRGMRALLDTTPELASDLVYRMM